MLRKSVIIPQKAGTYEHSIHISIIGYFEKEANHYISRSGIDEYIMIYCVEGNGFFTTNGISQQIQKGDLIFCDKNIPHSYGNRTDSFWSVLWVHFTGEISWFLNNYKKNSDNFVCKIGYQPYLSDLFWKIINSADNNFDAAGSIRGQANLELLLCNIIDTTNTIFMPSYIKKTVAFMEESVYSNINLDEISKLVNVSKHHLVRKFKDTTRYTPMEYFHKLKVQKACDMLIGTEYTISEISESLCYNTPNYFSEQFKTITGYSPRSFRKFILKK